MLRIGLPTSIRFRAAGSVEPAMAAAAAKGFGSDAKCVARSRMSCGDSGPTNTPMTSGLRLPLL